MKFGLVAVKDREHLNFPWAYGCQRQVPSNESHSPSMTDKGSKIKIVQKMWMSDMRPTGNQEITYCTTIAVLSPHPPSLKVEVETLFINGLQRILEADCQLWCGLIYVINYVPGSNTVCGFGEHYGECCWTYISMKRDGGRVDLQSHAPLVWHNIYP